jgi:hypothetical protein
MNCTQSASRAVTRSSDPTAAVPIILADVEGPLRMFAVDFNLSVAVVGGSATADGEAIEVVSGVSLRGGGSEDG